jgi:hypothetical protein
MSMHVTTLPLSAKHVPVTSPTYPVPTTAIFIAAYAPDAKMVESAGITVISRRELVHTIRSDY